MHPIRVSFLASLLTLTACGVGSVDLQARALRTFGPIEDWHLPPPVDAAEVELGRLLFWDPILSGNRDVACASCHHPDSGYAERLDLSRGVGAVGLSERRRGGTLVKRNSMSILNVALNGIAEPEDVYDARSAPMFWDSRVFSLERQALRPAHSREEMRGTVYTEASTVRVLAARIAAISEYRDKFERAFPGEPIGEDTISRAIAAFERTLIAVDSPFDRYLAGDLTALTPQEESGLDAFFEANCHRCHSGPMFSDFDLHRTGVPDNRRLDEVDVGDGDGRFRTATLRNLALNPPYMHNGVFQDLEAVVEFYDDEVRRVDVPGGADDDLAAFLLALSDDGFDRTIPDRVPSGLPVGGNID